MEFLSRIGQLHKILIAFSLAAISMVASGQNAMIYEPMIYTAKQQEILTFLADDKVAGRSTGSEGKMIAERFIVEKFKEYGLKPFKWSYTQSFKHDDTTVVRNIMGVVPAIIKTDEYIVVSAHYDHLGTINNKIYNGADDNASGVTALLNIAEMVSRLRKDGKGPQKNILFVAFDGKELSMAGSNYFVKSISGTRNKVLCNLNIDIIGSDLVPVHKDRPEYMIVLGNNTLKKEHQDYLRYINARSRFNLDIDYTFYSSKDFTKMMLKLGDHYSFAQDGIPALLFTSGFHHHTYKPTDDDNLINYELLRKRTLVIYHLLCRLAL